jgi:hypothetical protein
VIPAGNKLELQNGRTKLHLPHETYQERHRRSGKPCRWT